MKVLVADDDRVSRRLLEATVARLGHEVTAVADGLQAMAALAAPGGPRLAILDWMMPGADGIDVCRTARHRNGPYIYVVLLTARDQREDMLSAFEAEADEFLTKPFDALELRARLRSGERVLKLQQDLLDAQAALRYEATHDHLTGLLNRGAILQTLRGEARRASREGRPLAVGLIDIDHFKQINDTLGHGAGDQVLREVAERMAGETREHERIGRYGGEEFLIVLPGADAHVASRAAERLRSVVSDEPMLPGTARLTVTTSTGVAWSLEPFETVDELVQLADAALYQAKAAGRNRVVACSAVGSEPGATGAAARLLRAHAESLPLHQE
jgi:diguanylate cyclase (GGDEF)-like protein